MKQKRFFQDLAVVTAATALIGIATCCYIRAGLGSDAVAVFNEGLSIFAGLSLGTASWCMNIGLMLIALLTARKYIAWTTVFNSLLCGAFIDLADWLLAPVFAFDGGLLYRCLLFAAGPLLVALGCTLMIQKCSGMSVNDAITTGIAQRLGCSFRTVRVSMDGILMLTGWLMGGVVGFGSVAAVLCTGPLIQWFCQLVKKA